MGWEGLYRLGLAAESKSPVFFHRLPVAALSKGTPIPPPEKTRRKEGGFAISPNAIIPAPD